MPELRFQIEEAKVVPFAATPMLGFRLKITNAVAGEAIHSVLVQAQVRIEPSRRRYSDAEEQRLIELFGPRERWDKTQKSMLWTQTAVTVPSFREMVQIELPVPCTYDFNVAASKYFYGIEDGDVPLLVLYSGTIFYQSKDAPLQISPIHHNQESTFRFPVAIYKAMMRDHYPNGALLSVGHAAFDRLHRYRADHGFLTWDQTLENLLAQGEER